MSAQAVKKEKKFDLTQGPIFKGLITLSLPIMATSLMQTAHNLTNMFWLGWLGQDYVAASGVAGQFIWLSMAFMMMCRIGAEIGVSQNIGRGEPQEAKSYAQNGFMLALSIGIVFCIFVIIFRRQLISFFPLADHVRAMAEDYLAIIAFSVPFTFAHFLITGVFSGFGNTKLPFYINSAALALNIILSPILIFGLGLGFIGAGISMVTAAVFNFCLKLWAMTKYSGRPFPDYTPFVKIAADKIIQILKWGLPVAAESLLFTLLFMVVSRLIATFGTGAIAAHNVGLQVESLSFMVGGGFASAITAFVGQNYGAKKWGRMRSTVRVATIFMACYGAAVTLFLFFGAYPMVGAFLDDPDAISIGAAYLRMMAFAQILFCIESVASGSFRGRGLTQKPAVVSISCNVFRVFITYILAHTFLGINGIWLGITLAMTIRSVWLIIWHKLNMRKTPRVDEEISATT